MFYEEEFELTEETVQYAHNIATDADRASSHIIILNSTSPSLQNKIAQDLQRLLPGPYTHISIYPYLQTANHTADLSALHRQIIECASNGENIIVSYNPFFDDTLSSFKKSLKPFTPHLVNLFSRDQKPLFTLQAELDLCLEDLSTEQLAYAILQSIALEKK